MSRRKFEVGTIYAVQIINADGYIKIGWTSNLRRRWHGGRSTDCPYEFRLLAMFKNNQLYERRIHNYLARDRVRGEWFRPTERVMKVVEAMKKVSPDKEAMEYLYADGKTRRRLAEASIQKHWRSFKQGKG